MGILAQVQCPNQVAEGFYSYRSQFPKSHELLDSNTVS